MRNARRVALGLPVVATLAVMGARAQTQTSVWDGVFSREQADRGQTVYIEHCARCHGSGLGGLEAAPALVGPTFYANWEGDTLNALFERIRTTMPQEAPGSLPRAQNADLLAYMLRESGYPAGEAALEGQAGTLSQITIVTYRP